MDLRNSSMRSGETLPFNLHTASTSRASDNRFPEMPNNFLCGVCRELMDGNVYICQNNHSRLCSACCEDLQPCPDCDWIVLAADFTPRNFALEKELALVKKDTGHRSVQQREQGPNHSTTQAPGNRSLDLPRHLLCALCRQLMDGHIYFCHNKHSLLCSACCQEQEPCPDCNSIIIVETNTPRNFTMEEQISQMKEKNPALSQLSGLRMLPCHYKAAGCNNRLPTLELAEHCGTRADCLFRTVECPVITTRSFCQWKGCNSKLGDHIRSEHPECCLGKEGATLHKLDSDSSQLYVIRLGAFNFLLHVNVDVAGGRVSWAVALIGTGHTARSWIYEVQIYNKDKPLRKVTLTNICVSDAIPKQEMLTRCAQLPLCYGLSYLNAQQNLTYKVYIKNRRNKGK